MASKPKKFARSKTSNMCRISSLVGEPNPGMAPGAIRETIRIKIAVDAARAKTPGAQPWWMPTINTNTV